MSTAAAKATSAFGSLGVSGSDSFDIAGTAQKSFAFANALAVDGLTIDFAPLNGAQGTLLVSYTLHGLISSANQGAAFAGVGVIVNTASGHQEFEKQYNASANGAFAVPQAFTFTYGQQFGLGLQLDVAAGAVRPLDPSAADALLGFDAITLTGQGSGTADFFNTLELTGLQVLDPLGKDISSQVLFSSASGTVYTPNGVSAVPEPATFLLIGTGIAGLVTRRRRQTKSQTT
jgi:hypothetical protein